MGWYLNFTNIFLNHIVLVATGEKGNENHSNKEMVAVFLKHCQ